MHCHPDQIKARRKNVRSLRNKVGGVVKEYYGNLANTIPPPGMVNSIFEKIRQGTESPHTIAEIMEKASRVGVAFNKGGLQLIPKDQIIFSGKK